ncbi:MAG: co-chaperone GroES [Oscillospiraceae bacterium]|jgi:chaperonin GroES|nr:co-chaperone GroES [Oscillospiraceae bacterium]
MKLVPLEDRVILRQIAAEEKTKGGIILTSAAQEKPQIYEVVAANTGSVTVDGKDVKISVKPGDRVITGKYTGTQVKVDEDELTIVKQSDILAIVQ